MKKISTCKKPEFHDLPSQFGLGFAVQPFLQLIGLLQFRYFFQLICRGSEKYGQRPAYTSFSKVLHGAEKNISVEVVPHHQEQGIGGCRNPERPYRKNPLKIEEESGHLGCKQKKNRDNEKDGVIIMSETVTHVPS